MDFLLRRWWIGKYRLPPSHELFQGQSIEELTLEWYSDLFDELEGLTTLLQTSPNGLSEVGHARLAATQEALGIPDDERIVTGDPLIDYWEAEMRAGREPDLDMTVEDLRERKKNARRH